MAWTMFWPTHCNSAELHRLAQLSPTTISFWKLMLPVSQQDVRLGQSTHSSSWCQRSQALEGT
jgi:hypothetical protein